MASSPLANKLSVVIIAHGKPELTAACLRTVDCKRFQVVLMDNASPAEALREWPGVEFFQNDCNDPVSKARNKAARHASGEAIVFVDNDVTLAPDTLDRMLASPGAIVGPRLLYPNGRIQCAGVGLGVGVTTRNLFHGESGVFPPALIAREVTSVIGACMLFRRNVWESIHGFDEGYTSNDFEDTDACLRAREHGFRAWYEASAVAVHISGSTRATPNAVPLRYERWNARIPEYWTALEYRFLRKQIEALKTNVTSTDVAAARNLAKRLSTLDELRAAEARIAPLVDEHESALERLANQ